MLPLFILHYNYLLKFFNYRRLNSNIWYLYSKMIDHLCHWLYNSTISNFFVIFSLIRQSYKNYIYPSFLIYFNYIIKFLWPLHNWYIIYSTKSFWKDNKKSNKIFIYLTNDISLLNYDWRESDPPVLILSVGDNLDFKIYNYLEKNT